MNDFLKIFFGLVVLVSAFMFGRNYGESEFKESENYQSLVQFKQEALLDKASNEDFKAKIQNIVDQSEKKQAEALLTEIMNVFLLDLGINIQNQKLLAQIRGEKENLKPASIAAPNLVQEKPLNTQQALKRIEAKVERDEAKLKQQLGKLKSYEWMLSQSEHSDQVRRNLKQTEVKNLDTILKDAVRVAPEELQQFFGSYKGKFFDIENKVYGTMSYKLSLTPKELNAEISLFRPGQKPTQIQFGADQVGYRTLASDAIYMSSGANFFQLYKINQTQQIAGHYYERLVNGTTNKIGSFVLNKIPNFSSEIQ